MLLLSFVGIQNGGAMDFVPVSPDTLVIEKSMSSSEDAARELENLAMRLSLDMRQDVEYDQKHVQELVDFVERNRRDVAGLTGKVYLAFYLTIVRQDGRLQHEHRRELEEKALAIFASVATQFPNTWQGKLSSIYDAEVLALKPDDDKQRHIDRARRALPIAAMVDEDSSFRSFQKALGIDDPLELSLRSQIISGLLDIGDPAAARKELGVIKQKFPQFKTTVRLEKRLASFNK